MTRPQQQRAQLDDPDEQPVRRPRRQRIVCDPTAVHGDSLDTQRDSKGRFQPGHRQSVGNVSKTRDGALKRALAVAVTDQDMVKIVRVAVRQAVAGSDRARRWLSEHLHGRPRQAQDDAVLGIELPPLDSAQHCADAARVVLAAMGTKAITIAEGERVIALVDAAREALVTADLEQRIAAIEATSSNNWEQ